MSIMQALILAAGMGKRLKQLTADNTKCMIKVNGVTLIDRMLHQLDQLDLTQIIIVVGYKGDSLVEYINTIPIKTNIVFVENPIYYKTNNIYSLYLAKDYLTLDDTILLESDLIFEDAILKQLIEDPRKTLALVDKYESWMDGTVVSLDEQDVILEFIPGKRFKFEDIPSYYKTLNIYKFSKEFSKTHYVPFLIAYSQALGNNEYYEQVLRVIVTLGDQEIKAKRLTGQIWYEIDDIQDLDIAQSMFHPDNKKKIASMHKRFGGYWRYPKLLDFCYLVNPYFPPQKLMDEIKSSFEKLLCQYPSGLQVNTLLAAKNFSVPQDYITIGNGAAELIKVIMSNIKGKTGFIKPTFEEYPNRYGNKAIVFIPKNEFFQYDDQDIIHYFDDKELNALVLINPDNPSGNYLNSSQLRHILEWTRKKGILLILDESFSDFADEKDNTLICEETLESFPNLLVIKSISKSYGVPGLRLGVAASSNNEYIQAINKELLIWNINSFAEFYMQIAEKYNGDYQEALDRFRMERLLFKQQLEQIKEITVIPSQANYFMCKLNPPYTASWVTEQLLINNNILIKDLSGKAGFENKEFIRIAVKTREENNTLAEALKELFYQSKE